MFDILIDERFSWTPEAVEAFKVMLIATKREENTYDKPTGDTISRQDTIQTIREYERDSTAPIDYVRIIELQPPARPAIAPIEYRDCANAMLRMWIDNVLTDGEYSRIMDKLNAFDKAKESDEDDKSG